MRELIGSSAFVLLLSLEPTDDAPLLLIAFVYALLIGALIWAWRGHGDSMRVRPDRVRRVRVLR